MVVRTACAACGTADASTRCPASSSPPGVPRRRCVERALQAARTDVGVGGHALHFQCDTARAGDRTDFADHRARRFAERRAARSGLCRFAFGQHRAVAREQRARRGQRRAAAERLARPHARERQRARPGDRFAAFGAARDAHTHVQRERAEQTRVHDHRHAHRAARFAARLAGRAQAGGSRRAHGFVIGGGELVGVERSPRRRVGVCVHRCVVVARPRRDEALGERVGRRGPSVGADDRTDREGHGGQRDDRTRAAHAKRLLVSQSAVEHGG